MRARLVWWPVMAMFLLTLVCVGTAPPATPAGAVETAVALTLEVRLRLFGQRNVEFHRMILRST